LQLGGILTVADDLLKNDGQKFLEMMEQLADRRMQRAEEAAAELDAISEDGEGDEDELDEEEDEDVSTNSMVAVGRSGLAVLGRVCMLTLSSLSLQDHLTDEQRMEEGRRMFQIFAARLFEQRVLSAYREKVAQERQLQLLRELEEEDLIEKEREAKKQKENQKKKDKKKWVILCAAWDTGISTDSKRGISSRSRPTGKLSRRRKRSASSARGSRLPKKLLRAKRLRSRGLRKPRSRKTFEPSAKPRGKPRRTSV
jgi:hypothetical protein